MHIPEICTGDREGHEMRCISGCGEDPASAQATAILNLDYVVVIQHRDKVQVKMYGDR
jgi:hypothetical protein